MDCQASPDRRPRTPGVVLPYRCIRPRRKGEWLGGPAIGSAKEHPPGWGHASSLGRLQVAPRQPPLRTPIAICPGAVRPRRRRAPGLQDTSTKQHTSRGLQKDSQIPPERPRRHVDVVEVPEVIVVERVATRDLPQTRHSRRYREPDRRPPGDLLGLVDRERPRTN